MVTGCMQTMQRLVREEAVHLRSGWAHCQVIGQRISWAWVLVVHL